MQGVGVGIGPNPGRGLLRDVENGGRRRQIFFGSRAGGARDRPAERNRSRTRPICRRNGQPRLDRPRYLRSGKSQHRIATVGAVRSGIAGAVAAWENSDEAGAAAPQSQECSAQRTGAGANHTRHRRRIRVQSCSRATSPEPAAIHALHSQRERSAGDRNEYASGSVRRQTWRCREVRPRPQKCLSAPRRSPAALRYRRTASGTSQAQARAGA